MKRRDLNDVELRDILAELLPLVRIDHVIPYNSEILTSTIKRGLLSSPPCHMISDEGCGQCVAAWIRNKNMGIYQRPRLFTPYFEEAKVSTEIYMKKYFRNLIDLPDVDSLGLDQENPVCVIFKHHDNLSSGFPTRSNTYQAVL